MQRKDLELDNSMFDNFRQRFGLKIVKITRKAASANQEATDKFPDAIKKISEKKGYLLNRFLMQTKAPYSGGENATKGIY